MTPKSGRIRSTPGLLGLGEQDAAVDDQQLAVELQHGHVAADLAQPAERHDAQAALGQRRRGLEVQVRLGDLTAHSAMPAGGQVDAQLRDLLGGGVDQRRPDRAGRQAQLAQRRLDHDRALGAEDAGVDRQQALVDRARLDQVAGLDGGDELGQPGADEVADHADDADGAERQQREVQHVLAAVVGEVGAGQGPGDGARGRPWRP